MVPSAYVHIPFCDSICAYCDFVRIQKNEQFFSSWKEKLIQEFNLGENVPICLIPIGYKSEDCPLNPLHNVRKDLSETVKYI